MSNLQDTIPVLALSWIAHDHDHLQRFLALSGLQADQIRHLIDEKTFKAGLLDYLLAHEPTLLSFCKENNLSANDVQIPEIYLQALNMDPEILPNALKRLHQITRVRTY